MTDPREEHPLWWWMFCGVVWTAKEQPDCHHFVTDIAPLPMLPLPDWHPFAKPFVAGRKDTAA